MSAPEVGERLGKYRLLELVGQGGMASVYRATDVDLDREVAVKVLHPHLQTRRDARKRFRREAKSVAKLEHRNILTIYDYSGEDARTSYIVTQFINGPQLKQLNERTGTFPHEVAASLAKQVAEGLIVAHRAGIVHRDVKPENILIDEGGVAKIADFGIALIADTQEMTATGQILGSPYYMSPEHVLGKGLDARADVFSFGSLLFWMVTGRQAFEGPNPHAVLKRIVEGEVEPAERIAPAAGLAMAQIIRSCHVKDRDERHGSLEPVARMLDRYLAMSGVDDPVAEVGAFLESPADYRKTSAPRTVKALMHHGDDERRLGNVAPAMDAYNRVLAIDPDHAGALRRIQDVASERSRRRLVTRLGVLAVAAAVVVGLVVGGPRLLASMGWNDGPDDLLAGAGGLPAGDASSAPDAPPAPAADASTDRVALRPGVPDASSADAGADVQKKDANGKLPVKKPSGKALVKFLPIPPAVIIWVDGEEIGGYFNHQTMELDVGPHTIRFEPEKPESCEAVEWTVTVNPPRPDGSPQTIGKRLAFKPASLYVFSGGTPAKVSIDGRHVGQTGQTIKVDMKDSKKQVSVSVSADGYGTVTRGVTLDAGVASTLEVKLEPTGG